MSVPAIQRSILKSVDNYISRLDSLTEEEFQEDPPGGGWSYSEVFSHVFQVNLGALIAAERCFNGTHIKSAKNIHPLAWAVLFFGRFPPGRIRAPEQVASMVSKITREQARNLVVKFKKRLNEVAPTIGKSPGHHKIKHPVLGLLNARQWFRFIEVHSRHHEKQLERISRMLQKAR